MDAKAKNLLVGLVGAVLGGIVGYYTFTWAFHHGFYALMLPGGLIGLGGGLLVKDRSIVRATICGIFGLAVGLFSEWRNAPFIADQSLNYFLTHVHQLKGLTLIMLAGGTAFAAWLSLGKDKPPP